MDSALFAGLLASLAGLITFLLIHHFWIQPIWFVLPAGLPIAMLGGLAVGWSFSELQANLPPRPWTILAVMALIVAALAPAVILGQLRGPVLDMQTFRIAEGQGPTAIFRFVTELVLPSLVVGGLAGWLVGRSISAVLSTALAGLVFALGPGHNIPLLASTPAAWKGVLLLLAITFVSSVVLVEAAGRLPNPIFR